MTLICSTFPPSAVSLWKEIGSYFYLFVPVLTLHNLFCICRMPVDVEDLIQLLSVLAGEAGMQVTVKESVKGGIITGVVAAAGGLIMGPPGLAVGKSSIPCAFITFLVHCQAFLKSVAQCAYMTPEENILSGLMEEKKRKIRARNLHVNLIQEYCIFVHDLSKNVETILSGGALGGAVATYSSWGKFKSVGQVLLDMDKEQKQILYDSSMIILKKASINDMATLNAMLAGDLVLKKQLLDRVVDHVKDQLHMELNE